MRKKTAPVASFIIAAICVLYIAGFIIFYATYAQSHAEENGTTAIIAVGVLILPIAIGLLVISIKNCAGYIKYNRVMKYGTDYACKIVDYKTTRSAKRKWDIRIALVLKLDFGGVEKIIATGYDYVNAEYIYLNGLSEINCRYYRNTIIVTQEIPDKIYENLTMLGYVKSKFVRVFLKVWQIIIAVCVALILACVAATVATGSGLYLIIGAASISSINLLCGLIFAVCLFKGKLK